MQTETPSKDDAFTRVFGKEHPGRVRGMGLGVCPSQVFGSTGRTSMSSTTGAPSNAAWQELVSELKASNARIQALEEQMSYLMQNFAGQLPPGFPNSRVNQVNYCFSLFDFYNLE